MQNNQHWTAKYDFLNVPWYISPFLGLLSPMTRRLALWAIFFNVVIWLPAVASNEGTGYLVSAVMSFLVAWGLSHGSGLKMRYRHSFYLISYAFLVFYGTRISSEVAGSWLVFPILSVLVCVACVLLALIATFIYAVPVGVELVWEFWLVEPYTSWSEAPYDKRPKHWLFSWLSHFWKIDPDPEWEAKQLKLRRYRSLHDQ